MKHNISSHHEKEVSELFHDSYFSDISVFMRSGYVYTRILESVVNFF